MKAASASSAISKGPKALPAPDAPARLRSFDEVFSEHTLTAAEREALVWHLAAFRARKTVEALLPNTKPGAIDGQPDL